VKVPKKRAQGQRQSKRHQRHDFTIISFINTKGDDELLHSNRYMLTPLSPLAERREITLAVLRQQVLLHLGWA